MTTPTPRRWFQFHLATAVLAMLVTGALIPLELRIDRHVAETFSGIPIDRVEERGFPWVYSYQRFFDADWGSTIVVGEKTFSVQHLLLDAVFGVLLVTAVAFTCEFILRRSVARSRGPAT